MQEIWKDIDGYEGKYQISTKGRVRNIKGKILKPYENHKGYLKVGLCRNGKNEKKRVNRLVAEAFIPNKDNFPQVNHIDGNKQNNDVENLEWNTGSMNIRHSQRIGLYNHSKTVCQYDLNMNLIQKWESAAKASFYMGVNKNTIGNACRTKRIVKGYIWAYEESETSARLDSIPLVMAIFSQLNIKGVKPWNEMSQEEREKFIERRTKKHECC